MLSSFVTSSSVNPQSTSLLPTLLQALLACLAAACCGESWWHEDNETDLRKSKLGITKAEPSQSGASGEEVRTD